MTESIVVSAGVGDMISFVSGTVLFVVSILVIIEYRPYSLRMCNMPPPMMLQLGIFFGFLLTATNTVWWQMLNTLVVNVGCMSAGEFQQIGKFMDLPLKGGMALVGIIHLRAKKKMRDWDDRGGSA